MTDLGDHDGRNTHYAAYDPQFDRMGLAEQAGAALAAARRRRGGRA